MKQRNLYNTVIITIVYKGNISYGQKKTQALKKPWKWQRKVYQSMELHLDAAIDKVQKLSFDIHMHDMLRKWDDIYERNRDMFDRAKEDAPKPLGAQAVAE